MFFKKEDVNIKFFTMVDGLSQQEDILPYPAKNYIPSWWKDFPTYHEDTSTLKKCPAIPDFFSSGYIVPMWMNVKTLENDNGQIKYALNNFGNDFPSVDTHGDDQFLMHWKNKIANRDPEYILKINSPWYVVTPKGWSTLVVPLFYEFNNDYTILPGVVDTDIFHQMNHPIVVHSEGNGVEFLRGSPFICYIPFKRTKTNYSIIENDQELSDKINNSVQDWWNMGNIKNSYRRMQRNRNDINKI